MLGDNFLAIVPARSGSKRIPSKNITNLNGVPMIAWTIRHFHSLGIKVFVDTDSQEIATISESFGAEVPFLRDNYFDDYTPVSKSTAYFVERLTVHNLVDQEYVVQALANCPIRSITNSKSHLNSFLNNRKSSISASSYAWLNPLWAHTVDKHNRCKPVFPDSHGQRSQDISKTLCPNGNLWVSEKNVLLDQRTFYSDGYELFEYPFLESVDIDTYEDLEICKKLLSAFYGDGI